MVADKFYDQERPIPINLHNDCICALTVYYQGYNLKLLDCFGKLNSLSNWPITEPCKQIMRWTSDWRVWIKKAKKWMKPIYMYITITKGSGTKYNWMQICRESVSCSLMILKTTWGSYHKDQDLHDRKDWNFSTYKRGALLLTVHSIHWISSVQWNPRWRLEIQFSTWSQVQPRHFCSVIDAIYSTCFDTPESWQRDSV